MRQLLFTVIISITALAFGEVEARELAAPEVEILSVVPRSSDVKPYVMSLPAEGKPRLATTGDKNAAAAPGRNAPDRNPEQTTLAQGK
jgi:hypothetical protein